MASKFLKTSDGNYIATCEISRVVKTGHQNWVAVCLRGPDVRLALYSEEQLDNAMLGEIIPAQPGAIVHVISINNGEIQHDEKKVIAWLFMSGDTHPYPVSVDGASYLLDDSNIILHARPDGRWDAFGGGTYETIQEAEQALANRELREARVDFPKSETIDKQEAPSV
jgi:hypothetical protein